MNGDGDAGGINFKQDGSLGIFATISLVLLLWGYCWLKSYGGFRIPQNINVVFHEVAGLNDHAAVYLDGVRVGMVDSMEWQSPHRVLLRIRINKGKVEIPKGSKFDILTNGVVGAKYVEVLLPPEAETTARLEPLTEHDIVLGEDPVRPELAVNKLAIGLSAIDIDKLESNFEADRKRLVRAADQLAKLADQSMPIVKRTPELQEDVIKMTNSATRLTDNVNRIVDNPRFSGDLKQTAMELRATAESLHQTMSELETSLSDKPMRADILATMQQLRATSDNLRHSMSTIQTITGDRVLRTDVKEILKQAHEDLQSVNQILSNPKYGSDVKATMANARDALGDLDLVARQLHQILNKRQPLLRLMMGRPGYIENKRIDGTKIKKGATNGGAGGNSGPATVNTTTTTTKQTTTKKRGLKALLNPFHSDKPAEPAPAPVPAVAPAAPAGGSQSSSSSTSSSESTTTRITPPGNLPAPDWNNKSKLDTTPTIIPVPLNIKDPASQDK